ncbi:hypothetical protein ABZ825_43000 [Streptomyces tauricus]|uniref:hypothetical protein n=1 Tax=Streptomyces tauricus TaxID=68274 RepID=UPI0033F4BEBC
MRAVLETRQRTSAAQVKQLEAELEGVRAALADAEEVHRRRVIGLEQYLEALAEEGAPADVAGEVPRRRAVGPRRAVPHRRHASGDSAFASRVEGARARLKRLVERGWLVEVKPGRFTPPSSLSEQDSAGAGRPGGGS